MHVRTITSDTVSTDFDDLQYLNEKRLGVLLKELYPKDHFIHDKMIKDSGIRNRPDYYCKALQLIVEFDGYGHFTNAITILTDKRKDQVYSDMGITVIRIPYFVQLDAYTIKYFFGLDCCTDDGGEYVESVFPHGFIDKKAVLPANFCGLGLHKFAFWEHEMMNEDIFGELPLERSYYYQVKVLNRPLQAIVTVDDYNLVYTKHPELLTTCPT